MSKVFTITEGLENMGALRTGGQGSVYKGKRIGAIITAVKILPTPIHSEQADDKNYRNFINEVEKLKKVNEIPNPNVVKILNSGLTESGSFPFIEMQYIEGPDLEDLLKPPYNPIFTIRETIKLADQLANALAHCHNVGVKHGDIKSNNVKFNNDTGNYILLDFGLAIMSDEQRRSSVRNAGAVEFMAPEQHDGEMFFQTDVYSYGIILYELLAGTVPFPLINKGETSRNAVMLSHMEKSVPDLLALRSNHLPASWTEELRSREMKVPSWLLAIIRKCLEKRPENRFANGVALQEAILNHIHEDKRETIAPAPSQPLSAEVEEPRGAMVEVSRPIFAVMILLLFALGGYTAYSLWRGDLKPKVVYEAPPVTEQPETIAETTDSVPDTTAITPIIIDSAVQETNVDSLKEEFERQIGAEPKPAAPVKNSGSAETSATSDGKKYQLPKGILNFYDGPGTEYPKRAVFGLWVNARFTVVDEQNEFIYVTHKDNEGRVTKGWLDKKDLKEVQ